MEGRTTWCNSISIPPGTCHVQEEAAYAAPQRFAAAFPLPYNETTWGAEEAAPLQLCLTRGCARWPGWVSHEVPLGRPSAPFRAPRGEREDGSQPTPPAHPLFPHLEAAPRPRHKTMRGTGARATNGSESAGTQYPQAPVAAAVWHSFCAFQAALSPVLPLAACCPDGFFMVRVGEPIS
jgi:hypothetical protein